MKIRGSDAEGKGIIQVNNSKGNIMKDEHNKAELSRVKQDMMNCIIQLEEKGQNLERNAKRFQLDETTVVNDFRTVISKLNSPEKLYLIENALKALQMENEAKSWNSWLSKEERSNYDEKSKKIGGNFTTNGMFHEVGSLNNKEVELSKKIVELQEENKNLVLNMEELDRQHSESIEKLLGLKEEIEEKHQCLQDTYKQLHVDYSKAQNKITELESKLASKETSEYSIQTEIIECRERDIQTEEPTVENEKDVHEKEKNENYVEWIKSIEQKVRDTLTINHLETDEGESVFEVMTKKYVEMKWKKELLEKKIMEITRDLKETAEIKDGLQLECDDMRANIDSLLFEIQHLKSNLPSIPEDSEERIASLEGEVESLQEEVKRLKEENNTLRNTNLDLSRSDSMMMNRENVEVKAENAQQLLKELENKFMEAIGDRGKDTESIEVLKFSVEYMKNELKAFIFNVQRLEKELAVLREAKNDLERENENLIEKDKELHVDLQKTKDDLLARLDNVKAERDDLECDVFNLREELSDALSKIDEKEFMIQKLTAAECEANSKIESLNMKLSSLEQEYKKLKEEMKSREEEFKEVQEKLKDKECSLASLKNEYLHRQQKVEELQLENDHLRGKMERIPKLEESLAQRETIIDRLTESVKTKEAELNSLNNKKRETKGNQTDITYHDETITNLSDKLKTTEEKCRRLEDSLVSLKNETRDMINSKESLFENEKTEILTTLEEKLRENELLKKENTELTSKMTNVENELKVTIENNKESADMAKETIENLSHIVKEKDQKIETLTSENEIRTSNTSDLVNIQNERDELVKLVQIKHNESLQYHGEIQRLTQLLNEQASQIQDLLVKQDQNLTSLKQKDVELVQLQNELESVQLQLKQLKESNNNDKVCGIQAHFTQLTELTILKEKCNAMEAALIQEQSNSRMLQNQLTESINKKANSEKELERLRAHLMEIESSYTEEALIAEEMRKELEMKLAQAEEKIKNSSTAYTSANIRANQQIETLQQQMALIVQQRDDIQNKLSATEDKVLAQTTALTNLQIVLERFQTEKEADIKAATQKIRLELHESHKHQEELLNEISYLKDQLTEAKEYVQAASRLSEQLDKKAERIEQLNQEVERLTELVNTADQRIEEAMQSGVGKIDKTLMKNLLLGYLSSPAADKSSVLRVFANVLDFTETERAKTGLNGASAQNGWFSRFIGDEGKMSTKDQEASLSAAFVRFLESESKPKLQLPALPVSSSSSPRPTHTRQHSTSSTHSTLLLSDVTLPTFPDFVPVRNTGCILKEVLKDS